jgi:hypothetical protein
MGSFSVEPSVYNLQYWPRQTNRKDSQMGLFDFAKDVGRQLFDTDAEDALMY